MPIIQENKRTMARLSILLHAVMTFVQAISLPSREFPGKSVLHLSKYAEDPLSECLRPKLSANAIFKTPGQSGFLEDTIRYTTVSSPSYRAVVKTASEQDIANSIGCASRTNTSFLATSQRHGLSMTLASISNGLDIDITYLKQIQVDAYKNVMTIGGGVNFQEVVDVLYAKGKEISTGTCYCVGFMGATLGGGVGRLSGLHGVILDSLLSARIMLPNTVVEASKEKSPDLFWGIRGSGFNYGVVLNATFRIYDQVPQGLHLNADFKFPISQVKSYFEKLAEVSKSLPAQLSVLTYFNFDPGFNETVITSNAVYAGSEREGRRAVQFLVDQAPIQQNISMIPWNKLLQSSAFGATGPRICERGRRRTQRGVGVKQIDPDTYATLARMFREMQRQYPATIRSIVQVQLLPTQAVRAVPDDATAFPWRSHIAHVILSFEYTDASTDDDVTGYPRRMRDALVHTAGTNGLEIYVGYSHGDETLEQLYSKKKLPRLAVLKKTIDPSGLFNAYHPVPTAYP
ncbi:MAG: hypothetical protein M1816_002836 [Peltula sp. TS41687]|nr:MAG: hypothetical protein M1816_002836 [Peltula sp. TS41687]